MRNPGRSDTGDARPDRDDGHPAAEAGDDRVPADGDAAPVCAPDDPTAPESPVQEHAADDPDTGNADELADPADDVLVEEIPDFPDDDLLFDPLLSDEPIDLAAVRADDALIDALGGGDLDIAHDLVDPDDPLIAMLAAWAAAARPDVEPEPECTRPPLTLVRAPAEPAEAEPAETAAVAAAAPPAVPVAAEPTEQDEQEQDDVPAPAAAVRRLVPPAVLGVLDRARTRRRVTPRTRRQPTGFPLRRAGVAVVVAVIGVSGAAAAGSTAKPGEASFAMTRVFFSERAESLEAAQVVAEGLARAKVYIAQRQTALAAQELAAVENRLPDVRDEEGHTLLVDQQQRLADAAALTLPAPPDPRRTPTPIEPTTPDRDTAILAEPAPAPPDASTPAAASGVEAPAAEAPAAEAPAAEVPGGAAVVPPPSQDAVSGAAPAPGGGPAAPGGDGTARTPSEAATSTVSGVTDQGTVTADPTPTSGGESTTTVTATSAPTDPTTTSSRTAEPTTSSSTSTPPSSTRRPADGDGTVATGSVPVDGAPAAVRPAAYHTPMDEPPARRTHAAGSVTGDPADAAGAHLPVVRTVGRRPAAHHPAPVVVTTVPRPTQGPAHADPTVAGSRLSGVEIDLHSRAGAEVSPDR